MHAKANAILLLAKTKATKVKPIGTVVPKPKAERSEGVDEWTRFKRECVLLRGSRKGAKR
jgi:hypothetical protein